MTFLQAFALYLVMHQNEITALVSAVILLLRTVKPETWERVEKDWPRLANIARLARALAPDLWKASKALLAVLTGRPWRDLDPPKPEGQ
jgi:hypothetical protein